MSNRLGGGPHDNRGARAASAIAIIKAVADYKVCEGCGSVVFVKVIVCPDCRAYRYDASPERVRSTALTLGRLRPDKLTNG